jgi:hypothetical protein
MRPRRVLQNHALLNASASGTSRWPNDLQMIHLFVKITSSFVWSVYDTAVQRGPATDGVGVPAWRQAVPVPVQQ